MQGHEEGTPVCDRVKAIWWSRKRRQGQMKSEKE